MLANKLSPRFKSKTLPKIRQADGSFTLNPQRMMEVFHNFYSKLYAFDNGFASDKLEKFLDNLNLPTLKKEHKKILEAPISAEEVLTVIQNLKMDKAPGPDGFSSPYYKTFSVTPSPHLARFL